MNNRQAGRRRGRGGQRPQGNPSQGNRIDNRARGNANQLHEKYKTLARDAQMQGDRVNTEYYLQFADHYFRVLNETRSRFEEQNPRRQRDDADNDGDDDNDNDGQIEADDRGQDNQHRTRDRDEYRMNGRGNGNGNGHADSSDDDDDTGDRNDRDGDSRPRERVMRDRRPGNGGDRDQQRPAPQPPVENDEAPVVPKRGRGRPRREAQPIGDAPTFDAALLPPSLGVGTAANEDGETEEKPRRRRGRPPASEATNSAD